MNQSPVGDPTNFQLELAVRSTSLIMRLRPILRRLGIALLVLVTLSATSVAEERDAGGKVELSSAAPSGEQEAPPNVDDSRPEVASSSKESAGGDGKLIFSFRYQPWQDVLDWFADQADLSLLIESPPPGTFNYRDTRSYTPAEALDVLNGVLLTKGYTLVRNGRMLVLVNLEDGIPPNLVPDVPLAELDERGEYELMRVLFSVWSMTPEQAAEEIKPLLGPQGSVVVLPQARAIQVTETGGRLRTIRGVINAVEQPDEAHAGVREFELKHLTVAAAMPTIRHMLGIPEEASSTPDGTLQITKSTLGEKLLVRGTAQHAARIEEVLRLIDVPEASSGIDGTPQMEVYSLATASPEAVLEVLKSVMADDPNVRLTTDPKTGYIIAFARPSQQATIRATIDQMQKEARQLDVIPLASVDPQIAVMAINKLFGATGEEPDPTAPRVDADITSRSLLVRGTANQVEQIRGLLQKMGESEDGAGLAANPQKVRILPLTGAAARSAISQIQEIWPTLHPNRIRVITPNESIRSYTPGIDNVPRASDEPSDDLRLQSMPSDTTPELWQNLLDADPSAAMPRIESQPGATSATPAHDRSAGARTKGARPKLMRFAANETASVEGIEQTEQTGGATSTNGNGDRGGATSGNGVSGSLDNSTENTSGASIVVAPGPGGLVIASEDVAALDELEDLLNVIAGRTAATGREYAVFYLKFSKAATIAEVLKAIFGGKSGSSDGGLVGDMASAALGDLGGGLMGDLLLGGGGDSSAGFTSGSIDIVPDARLNALIVRAKQTDLDTIEQLLKVLDQRVGPEEVEASARPRLIPVYNTKASDIAQVVQQVYQDRLGGGGAMSPQEMMRMLRGGNGANVESQVEPMSIGIDERSNSLVVRAPDPLFDEVRLLVSSLDQEQLESAETTRVVSLKHSNSSAVQKAITSIMGNVTTNSQSAGGDRDDRRRRDDDDDSPEEQARRNMRRQFEMMREFQQMRERMERGRGGDRGGARGGFRGRGGDRGGPGGGGPGGGPGGDRGGR